VRPVRRFTNPPWYETRPYRNSRASIASAWYASAWFTNGSCLLNASNALHGGSRSFLSSFALMSSGKSSEAVGKRRSRAFVSLVLRLAEYELPAIGVVAEIQPVVAVPVGLSAGNGIPGGARIHAANQNVGLVSPPFIDELRHSFPVVRARASILETWLLLLRSRKAGVWFGLSPPAPLLAYQQ
jgi:hypothetical protein